MKELLLLASNKKDDIHKIKEKIQEILNTLDDVYCDEHTKLKTIYVENHPDYDGKPSFICDYCPNPSKKMKFYSNIISDYASVINQIKAAAEDKEKQNFCIPSKMIEECSENNNQIENSSKELCELAHQFDNVFIPGILAKFATSEELFKLNEILKTISFNEQGKPIYENIGTHPEREKQYVKLAKILISFKGENFDLNQKFTILLKEFLKKIISNRLNIVNKSTFIIKFLTSEFYDYIFKLEGIEKDEEFLKSLNYIVYTQKEVDEMLNSNNKKLNLLEMQFKECQTKLNQALIDKAAIQNQLNVSNNQTMVFSSDQSQEVNQLQEKLNSQTLLNKNLLLEKEDLNTKINQMTLEYTNLTLKINNFAEETRHNTDLSSLNISLLNDLKKQVNLNKTLELTIQDLQEKLNVCNSRIQANEQLIKTQIEIIKRYTEEQPVMNMDDNTDLLNRSRHETDNILRKIERIEKNQMNKSMTCNFNFCDDFDIDSPDIKSGNNSAYQPSSPNNINSRLNRSLNINLNKDQPNNNLLSENLFNIPSQQKNIFDGTDIHTKLANILFSESDKISDKYRNTVKDLKPKRVFKIAFSNDLLLCDSNWKSIRDWIGETDIFSEPIQPKLLFKANRDGFAAQEFKLRCNGIKNTLTIAKTNHGKLFGGFTPLVWETPSEPISYSNDPNEKTFIFSCDFNEKYSLKTNQYAICNTQNQGPIFGEKSDFEIVDKCNLSSNNNCNLGYSYKCHRTYEEFLGDKHYLIEDYEVYEII